MSSQSVAVVLWTESVAPVVTQPSTLSLSTAMGNHRPIGGDGEPKGGGTASGPEGDTPEVGADAAAAAADIMDVPGTDLSDSEENSGDSFVVLDAPPPAAEYDSAKYAEEKVRHSSGGGEKHKADDDGDAGNEAAVPKRKKYASPGGPAATAAEGEKGSAEEKMDEEKRGSANGEDVVESRGTCLGSPFKNPIHFAIPFNNFAPPQEPRVTIKLQKMPHKMPLNSWMIITLKRAHYSQFKQGLYKIDFCWHV